MNGNGEYARRPDASMAIRDPDLVIPRSLCRVVLRCGIQYVPAVEDPLVGGIGTGRQDDPRSFAADRIARYFRSRPPPDVDMVRNSFAEGRPSVLAHPHVVIPCFRDHVGPSVRCLVQYAPRDVGPVEDFVDNYRGRAYKGFDEALLAVDRDVPASVPGRELDSRRQVRDGAVPPSGNYVAHAAPRRLFYLDAVLQPLIGVIHGGGKLHGAFSARLVEAYDLGRGLVNASRRVGAAASPDDHLGTDRIDRVVPHRSVDEARGREPRVLRHLRPGVRVGVVTISVVLGDCSVLSSPDEHLLTGPDGGMVPAC